MTMENQILLDIRSVIDGGLVTEIFSQNNPFISENFNLETAVINNQFEEGLSSSQGDHLCTVNVGETLLDHFKYPPTIENQNAIAKAEIYPHGNNSCGNEDLGNYKELNLPEEVEHTCSPYLPSDGVHFLSSVMTQHKNCSVPNSSVLSSEGTVDQNVFRPLIPPAAESSSSICGLPQTNASVYDEIVICQLEGGTQILCINNCATQELKPVYVLPQYQDQHNYLQSDVGNPVTAVLGQYLPVSGKLDLNEQEFEHGSLQSVASTATFQPESNLQVKVPSAGLPSHSGFTKSKKPCNCTKSQCLKLYCDCFANGDFCCNCNCNNCYNNPLHETERFKAIKVCLDRNPEAFLPKIGQTKLGEVKPHHNKGCNCRRSGCLKNYCECFEAKIMCSSICKCIGCKNYEESPDKKTQLTALNYMDIGSNEGNNPVLTSALEILPKLEKDRLRCLSWEEVKATCTCLLVQAEEAEKRGYSDCLGERMIMEEFGRCLSQILHA
ncbi:tesmin isoform X5 [Cygnus olor]|uniref:tesmin isoform X5 n=1 Tax=Cygnus olor TaxID=8869 RepID=UPI001ADDE89F|nr:tesmin isoform X5 [Cygnus olor]